MEVFHVSDSLFVAQVNIMIHMLITWIGQKVHVDLGYRMRKLR